MAIDILSVSLRALGFVALFQTGGIVLFFALGESELPASEPALRRIGIFSALLAAIVLVAQYALEAARMGGEIGGALDPALQEMVLRSGSSVTLSWRVLGLFLIVAGLRRRGVEHTLTGVIGVVILLASFTFVGHTANSAQRWLLSPVLLAHLCVVAFWFGALVPLYLVSAHEPAETSARVVERFSARALWLVPGLFAAGIVLAAGLLPDLAALRRPYGLLLLAKVSGFCALMLLAALNRWRFGPALRSGEAAAGRRFRSVVAAEYALIVAVLCVTAVMTTFFSPEA
ncbi:MAG TPA: CopD family protein [Steroidobacteraceae bacterium]|nr:CopD family protein [Steroidobacteraceae bacterium]